MNYYKNLYQFFKIFALILYPILICINCQCNMHEPLQVVFTANQHPKGPGETTSRGGRQAER